MSLEDLDTAAKLAEGLMANEGWTLMADWLAWRRSQALRLITHGRVLEQTDYVAATSVVSGVDQCRFVLDAIIQVAQERREAEELLAEEEQHV
jgi:predicted amidohydrolase